jgi:hypothetical protein
MQTVTGLQKKQYVDKIKYSLSPKIIYRRREFHNKEEDKNKMKILVTV